MAQYKNLAGKIVNGRGWNLTRQHEEEVRKRMKIKSDIKNIIEEEKKPHFRLRSDTRTPQEKLISNITSYILQNFDEKKLQS